jgi:hypothetical protein
VFDHVVQRDHVEGRRERVHHRFDPPREHAQPGALRDLDGALIRLDARHVPAGGLEFLQHAAVRAADFQHRSRCAAWPRG